MNKIAKKHGRPRKQPPPDAVTVITEYASKGATKRGVAQGLGTSFETFDRWLTEYPELAEALEAGRESERAALHNEVFKLAMNGAGKEKLMACMYLLNSRHNYREGEQEQQGNRVNITFNLPGAKKPDEFVQEVKE